MFFSQQSVPRNPLAGFILNVITMCALALGPLSATAATDLANYCDIKTQFASDVFDEREQLDKQEVLDSLTAEWYATNRAMPWYMVVDMQRVVNDAYRKYINGEYRLKDSSSLLEDTRNYCLYYGY